MPAALLLALALQSSLDVAPPEGRGLLLVETPACRVHAIALRDGERENSRRWLVLRTDRATGAMSTIVETGTVALPTRRISFQHTRLLGAATDGATLSLLVWHAPRMWDRPTHTGNAIEDGSLQLVTVDLASGGSTTRHSVAVPWTACDTAGSGTGLPRERLFAGALTRVDGRLLVQGRPLR